VRVAAFSLFFLKRKETEKRSRSVYGGSSLKRGEGGGEAEGARMGGTNVPDEGLSRRRKKGRVEEGEER